MSLPDPTVARPLFGYPVIGRAGLGNELFAWARCFLWCRDNQAPMLAPRWRQIHIGPYLRGERDKRQYHLLFHNAGYVGGWRRQQILWSARQLGETEWTAGEAASAKSTVVRFQGMRDHFTPLLGRHAEIRRELARITRPNYLPAGLPAEPFLGVHIRLGDFKNPPNQAALAGGEWNYRIDLHWYAHAIRAVRNAIGEECLALVCSDGEESELGPVLSLPNAAIHRSGSAIGDLLSLSAARILVASGSSFSMWASFLGQIPTVWFPGQRRWSLVGPEFGFESEPELAPDQDLPGSFLAAAARAWGDGAEKPARRIE